ncbi:MAG: hypothetical protein JW700_02255 [Candidatus Aenigmarchaeota archaeon]|nr:hypothetical protein [Candidatus Aenigmarchaeota archaeon]
MELYLIVIIIIVCLMVFTLSISFLVKTATGKSPNLGCKILAKTLWTIDILGNKISPLTAICDTMVPF